MGIHRGSLGRVPRQSGETRRLKKRKPTDPPYQSPFASNDASKWAVVVWTPNSQCWRREFGAKQDAYDYATSSEVDSIATAITVYGPNGERDEL